MYLNKTYGLLTFICGFIEPEKNYLGSLIQYGDNIIDFKKFVQIINEKLKQRCSAFENCYFFDLNELASSYGKRYISDEIWSHSNHGSFMAGNYGYHEWDSKRIEKYEDFTIQFKPHVSEFIRSIWTQLSDAINILKFNQSIKLVIIDLDDTLWRGVLAEETTINHAKLVEGWPLGFMEALLVLKKRGILLAIASNNDQSVIESLWDKVFFGRLLLSDFVSIRINWDDKSKKVGEILNEVNLLPLNTLFIDDNPRERARVKEIFPSMCILDIPYFEWKRFLLWSTITQVPYLTNESKNKTELIQQMIQRNRLDEGQDRFQYLHNLNIKLMPQFLCGELNSSRAFELLNKTNQFNCAGKNIDKIEFDAYLNNGNLIQFECKDRLSHYGIIAVVILDGNLIKQFVMSCRVFGLEIERAIISYIQKKINCEYLRIQFQTTQRNAPARNFLKLISIENGDAIFDVNNFIESPSFIEFI